MPAPWHRPRPIRNTRGVRLILSKVPSPFAWPCGMGSATRVERSSVGASDEAGDWLGAPRLCGTRQLTRRAIWFPDTRRIETRGVPMPIEGRWRAVARNATDTANAWSWIGYHPHHRRREWRAFPASWRCRSRARWANQTGSDMGVGSGSDRRWAAYSRARPGRISPISGLRARTRTLVAILSWRSAGTRARSRSRRSSVKSG